MSHTHSHTNTNTNTDTPTHQFRNHSKLFGKHFKEFSSKNAQTFSSYAFLKQKIKSKTNYQARILSFRPIFKGII